MSVRARAGALLAVLLVAVLALAFGPWSGKQPVHGEGEAHGLLFPDVLGYRIQETGDSCSLTCTDGTVYVQHTGTLEDCEAMRLSMLKERYGEGKSNVPAATLGGKQIWGDRFVFCGWRIQRNVLTGHFRLLDADDVRRAWGSYEACRVVFEGERLERKLAPRSRHLIVLLHGLGRSKDSFRKLAGQLQLTGLEVAAINYPSSFHSIEEHAKLVAEVLDHYAGVDTVSFVTHSLGGIVLRMLFEQKGAWMRRVHPFRAVMLGPPNQGSFLAKNLAKLSLYRVLTGTTGQELQPEAVRRLPAPACDFAVIAGGLGDGDGFNPLIPGDDDAVVALSSTKLDGMLDFLRLPVLHKDLMKDERAIAAILRFLRNGRFR